MEQVQLKPAFHVEPGWQKQLEEILVSPIMHRLAAFLADERAGGNLIYPKEPDIFNAFWRTPFEKVRVVIVGQDPYHGPGQAHGLSFSVPPGVALPPSLQNIYTELSQDLNVPPPKTGCLIPWAEQGVLLLNAILTVRQGQPLSHQGKGWEKFTDAAIQALVKRKKPVAFVLWGKYAQEKWSFVKQHTEQRPETERHTILKSVHPSPLSVHRGFFGSRPFSQINQWLESQGEQPIDWVKNL